MGLNNQRKNKMKKINFSLKNIEKEIKKFESVALGIEEQAFKESGYSGGPSSVYGNPTFQGGPFGFGGALQLAGGLAEPVKKLKKKRDKEAVFNIASQQRINRGYPAPQSVSGFPGGESGAGIRSGQRFPNEIEPAAISAEKLDDMIEDEYEKDDKAYFGLNEDEEDVEKEEELEMEKEDLKEFGASGVQGPMRGVPSDGNYRDLPGYPRPNTIEKPGNFIPSVEGDVDGDGEEDEYLSDLEYVNDVLRLNGLDIKPGHVKRLFGAGNLEENMLHERTLYHGTVIDHLDSIRDYGLEGRLGDWVRDSYGASLPEEWDEEDVEEQLGGVIFAAEKSELDKAGGAIRYHVGKKLNKSINDVSVDDIRRYGMLAIIREIDVEDDEDWKRRPKHGKESWYDEYPIAAEPGDWYLEDQVAYVDDILVGQKLVDFLRQNNALGPIDEEKRRQLIKLLVKIHGPEKRDEIVKKVKSMPDDKVSEMLHLVKRDMKANTAKKENKNYSLKKLFFNEAYVSPPYGPEPDRGTERYKQGEWNEVPRGDDWLVHHVDYSGGHAATEAAEESPGAMAYGQIAKPKSFVPEDWAQRHPKTKEGPMDIEKLREIIDREVKRAIKLEMKIKKEAYTGIKDKTGKGDPKGGSAAFEKSRKEVFDYDEKQKPEGIEDLKNYHMEKDE